MRILQTVLVIAGVAAITALAGAVGGPTPAVDSPTPSEQAGPMDRQEISGRWTGLMLDAEGRRARINASLEVADGEAKGGVEYSIIDAEKVYDQKGEVQGRLDGDEAYLEFRVETRGGPMSVRFTGRVRDAGSHARATMYGSYEVAGEGADDLSGGVAILWLYVDQE